MTVQFTLIANIVRSLAFSNLFDTEYHCTQIVPCFEKYIFFQICLSPLLLYLKECLVVVLQLHYQEGTMALKTLTHGRFGFCGKKRTSHHLGITLVRLWGVEGNFEQSIILGQQKVDSSSFSSQVQQVYLLSVKDEKLRIYFGEFLNIPVRSCSLHIEYTKLYGLKSPRFQDKYNSHADVGLRPCIFTMIDSSFWF